MNKNILFEKAGNIGKRFPWYGTLIEKSASFDELPFMSREILDENYYNKLDQADFITFTTSGTSKGIKRKIFFSPEEIAYNNGQKVNLFGNFIGSNDNVAIVVGIGLAASSAENVFKALNKKAFVISHNDPLEKLIAEFDKYHPQVLYTMPSLLDSILELSAEIDISNIKKIITVGEILSPGARNKAANILKIQPGDILNTYGCVELGLLAYECDHCQRFHVMENLFPETVEKVGEQSFGKSSDPIGVFVITSLWRENIPAIRYITYDLVEDLAETHCQNQNYFTFKRILGRIGNEFKHGERISLYDIESSLLYVLPDASFRIVIKNNQVVVELADKNYSQAQLKEAGMRINGANSAVETMIENKFLKKIDLKVIPKSESENINWKKRTVYEY
jgi:phenylacetate-coenzyme A ligase PaaK-like adenylate-forming protein